MKLARAALCPVARGLDDPLGAGHATALPTRLPAPRPGCHRSAAPKARTHTAGVHGVLNAAIAAAAIAAAAIAAAVTAAAVTAAVRVALAVGAAGGAKPCLETQ
jgi:hypothetical protein